jgi:hypothetical protein
MNRELQLENQRLRKLHGNVFDSKGGTPSVESLLDEAGGVRLLSLLLIQIHNIHTLMQRIFSLFFKIHLRTTTPTLFGTTV